MRPRIPSAPENRYLLALEREFPGPMRWTLDGYADHGASPIAVGYGAGIQGALWWRVDRRGRVEVVSVAVAKRHRGKGIGRALMEAAIRIAHGAPVVLDVRPDNPQALNLYTSLGFKRVRKNGSNIRMLRVG